MRSKALLVAVVASAAVAACSGGGSHVSAAGQNEQSPTPTPTPTVAVPSPTGVPLTGDPLTGTGDRSGPVVAIKVDNAFLARPYQRGLTQASIVYQELVEGGSTRFMAVFEGPLKGEVGPIRSARESDIDVLRGLGQPVLGFSGANRGVLAIFRTAASKHYLVNANYGAYPSAYRLGEHRRDARNFFSTPAKLARKASGTASDAVDIGWRFGPSTGGVPAASGTVAFSPQSKIKVRYNAATGRYVLSQGSRVIPVSPANVVIQRVVTKPSRFSDVHGMNTPYTISTGKGGVVVLRDGRRIDGKWSRTGFGPTRLLSGGNTDILLKPGPTWVFLLPRAGTISVG